MKFKLKYIYLFVLFSGCTFLNTHDNGLIEKELRFIEVTPIVTKDYYILAFEDNSDSLYFIISEYFNNDTNNLPKLKRLVNNCWYKLQLERIEETVSIDFFIRGGRFKYSYYDFIKNDTLTGRIYRSSDITEVSLKK